VLVVVLVETLYAKALLKTGVIKLSRLHPHACAFRSRLPLAMKPAIIPTKKHTLGTVSARHRLLASASGPVNGRDTVQRRSAAGRPKHPLAEDPLAKE
jgi:hypothetical protein